MKVEPRVTKAKSGAHAKAVNRAFKGIRAQKTYSTATTGIGLGTIGVGVTLIVLVAPYGDTRSKNNAYRPDIPAVVAGPAVISRELPLYSRSEEIKTFDPKARPYPSTSGNRITFLGPQLVLRSPKLKIPPGTVVKAQLLSGASDGVVKAKYVSVLDADPSAESPFENGTVFIGRGMTAGDRLQIKFDKAILPDGQAGAIRGEALDQSDKIAGLRGSKLGEGALRLATGIGLNFLSGVSEGLQDAHGQQGVVVKDSSVKNALLQGTARASLSQSQEIMNDLHNSRPAIAVPSGTEILVVFLEGEGS